MTHTVIASTRPTRQLPVCNTKHFAIQTGGLFVNYVNHQTKNGQFQYQNRIRIEFGKFRLGIEIKSLPGIRTLRNILTGYL